MYQISNDSRGPKLSLDGLSGGGSVARGPVPAVTAASAIRHMLKEHQLEMSSPQGFYNLHQLEKQPNAHGVISQINEIVSKHVERRGFIAAEQLDVTSPDGIHSKIYAGQNYSNNGPVLVNAGHVQQMFANFIPPTEEELAARTIIGKENYGTMPGTESAFSGAIVKALQPRTMLIIGEHKGHLTKYLAECAPEDCLIFTVELPESVAQTNAVTEVDTINKCFVNYTQDQIGEAWRDTSVADRIIGLAVDSTSDAATTFFQGLTGKIDLVLVDGNHSLAPVQKDLLSASNLVSEKGVVLVDDFWKPARLFEVTQAVLNARSEIPALSHLYHLSWGVGNEAISSSLAFFIKESPEGQDNNR